MKRMILWALVPATVMTFALWSCSKQDTDRTTLKVRLTDAPLVAEEVNVDIQQVRVKFSEDSVKGWADLSTYAGIYNLLELQNGVDTLLATGTIPSNEVKEIRFVLGTQNSIKVAGVVFPLTIPSGSESGLKIKVDKKLNGTLDSLLIDFDAALSIHQNGNGNYLLKPVLKVK